MNNSGVINIFSVNQLIDEMNVLIAFYEKEYGYKKIRSSKIQKWINCVNNPETSNSEKFNLYFQIRRYVRALEVFKNNSDKIKQETITKMLGGGGDSNNDNSDDYFFEIDMARRFLSRDDFDSINLNDITDIIFKSSIMRGNVFVECKNIRSENSFEKNIRKANNQLSKVLDESSPCLNFGIISLNLSNVLDGNDYLSLLSPIVEDFINKYRTLKMDVREFLDDKNFETVMLSLLQGLLELKFRELFNRFERSNYRFHHCVAGIFYQVEMLVPFNNKEEFFIVRVATYYPFCSLDLSKFLFHPLASGV